MSSLTTEPAPLYRGIVQDILQRIRDGRLAPGDQIPTIERMCDNYHVSAITAKRAIAELQNQRMVRSVRGKGTFVATGHDASQWNEQPPALRSIALALCVNTRPDRYAHFFGVIWDAIERTARKHKLSFRLQSVPEGGSSFHVDLAYQPDPAEGLIFGTAVYPYSMMHLVHERRVPAVTIDAALVFTDAVLSDNLDGMQQLIDHVTSLGHRRLLLASRHPRSPNPTNENERTAAFDFICRMRGLEGRHIVADDDEGIFRHLRAKSGPTAILFTQDTPAHLFLARARERGLRVPQDVTVTGFDGWSAQGEGPQLTTMAVDRERLGERAVEALIEVSRHPHAIPCWHRVPGRLVTGETAAPPKCGA